MQQPTGGPKDSIPPVLLVENPPNLSTNFTDRKITLEFDEFIRLENQQREVSISPEMDELPNFQVRRRILHVDLPDSLAENTTYVLNFGQAIVDVNERNPFTNYSYVFSTGPEIDSLRISGTVVNALTNEPEREISVILIPTSQDSTFGKRKANIFATTDTNGRFSLNYLREDSYRIYALKEQNNDRIYNAPTESLGFLNDSIYLSADISGLNLRTSVPVAKDFRILNRGMDRAGRLFFKFNRPIDSPSIQIVAPAELDANKIIEFNNQRDSVSMWVETHTFDSLKLNIWDRDTILVDSLTFRRPRNDKYERNILLFDNLDRNKVDRVAHLQLTSNTPIQQINRGDIILLEDSVARTNFQLLRDSIDNKKVTIRYNWREKRAYNLTVKESAFNGYFGETNQEIKMDFTFDENDKYGDITLNITIPDTTISYVVQLLDDTKSRVIREDSITDHTVLKYSKYLEGKYRIRVIYDENNNGKWDPGDLDTKRQPEFTWNFEKTIIIRPNWEQEENINIPQAGTSNR